jgi:hypothetical protein
VIMAAGLRAIAKAVDHPPAPTVDAPVLDPTIQAVRDKLAISVIITPPRSSDMAGVTLGSP